MNFSPQSRVWIYQSERVLNQNEVIEIKSILDNFIQEWSAHGTALKAAYKILYSHFIVFIVDETQAAASGCSIDSSVRIIKQIEQKFNIDFFNRFNMAYKLNEELKIASKEDFETLISIKKITPDTIVFNNMVQTLTDFENKWELPLSQSWHAQIFAEQLNY